MALFTLVTFDDPAEANQVKNIFHKEGIRCFLMNENAFTSRPYQKGDYGLKLKVSDKDVRRVMQLIARAEGRPYGPAVKVVSCPACGMANEVKTRKAICKPLALLRYVFFGEEKQMVKCRVCHTDMNLHREAAEVMVK